MSSRIIAHQFMMTLRHPKLISVLFKHTTTLFSLSDHYILSREWRVIVDLGPYSRTLTSYEFSYSYPCIPGKDISMLLIMSRHA